MAPSLSPRSLAARSTSMSAGSIAGIAVGTVVGIALLIILLALPFIRRAIRDAKARRRGADTAAEMGMAPGGGRVSGLASPTSTRRLSVDHFSPTGAAARDSVPRPVKEYDMDGNSCEDSLPPAGAPGQTALATTGSLPRLDVSASGLRSPAVDGFSRMDSPLAMDAMGSMPPPPGPSSPTSDYKRRRKSSKGSITQAIEDIAGRASAVFRRTSTKSERNAPGASPMRAATFDIGDDVEPSVPPLLRDSIDHTVGAQADYYSGAPMSPPEAVDFPIAPPTTYLPPGSGNVTSRLISMSTVTALAGVQPKRTSSQSTDFSPMSPVSPPVKIEHAFDEDEEEGRDISGLRYGGPIVDEDESKVKAEFPASPGKSHLVPSPPMPAPGTVNPMDVWAPTSASEQSHQVTAELVRLNNSPSPAPPSNAWDSPSPAALDTLQAWTPATVPEEGEPAAPGAADDYDIDDYGANEYLSYPDQVGQPVIAEPIVIPPEDMQEADLRDTRMLDVSRDRSTPPPTSHSGLSNTNTPLTVPGSEYTNSASPGSHYASSPNTSSVAASPRSFTCDECGRTFDQIHKLNHHKRYHERPHECTHQGCGKKFGTKTHLDRHINDKHMKTRKYHCTEHNCPYSKQGGKSFPRKDNWRRHMQNKHGCNPDHEPVEVVDEPMTGV